MLTSMVRKEVRELAPLVVLALLVQFYLVAIDPLSGWVFSGHIPFVADALPGFLIFVGGTTAAVLGLWQTVWESNRGTWQFLFHRPTPRASIVAAKLLVGIILTLIVVGVPTLCYAIWAATPGTHPSPFRWSMTLWAVVIAAQLPVVYLGAFLSGLQSGRWLGSRALPLAAAALAMIGTQILFVAWPALLILGFVFEAIFVVAILEVVRAQDYS